MKTAQKLIQLAIKAKQENQVLTLAPEFILEAFHEYWDAESGFDVRAEILDDKIISDLKKGIND